MLPLFKIYFKRHFKILKRNRQKISDVHHDILYTHKMVSGKSDIICVVFRKENKIGAKKAFHETFFLKMPVFSRNRAVGMLDLPTIAVFLEEHIACPVETFPCTYSGLLLSIQKQSAT